MKQHSYSYLLLSYSLKRSAKYRCRDSRKRKRKKKSHSLYYRKVFLFTMGSETAIWLCENHNFRSVKKQFQLLLFFFYFDVAIPICTQMLPIIPEDRGLQLFFRARTPYSLESVQRPLLLQPLKNLSLISVRNFIKVPLKSLHSA